MSDKSKKDTPILRTCVNLGMTIPKPQPQKLTPITTNEVKTITPIKPKIDKNERQ